MTEHGPNTGFLQALIAPSVAAGGRVVVHQSKMVVAPRLIWFNAPTRLARYVSFAV